VEQRIENQKQNKQNSLPFLCYSSPLNLYIQQIYQKQQKPTTNKPTFESNLRFGYSGRLV